jgi:Tfp pilus assembly protein PilZ
MNECIGTHQVHKVDVQFDRRQDILNSYLTEPPFGGIMVKIQRPLSSGELVELCMSIQETGEKHILIGAALWCRSDEGIYLAGIGFLSTEVEKREMLLHVPEKTIENQAERREKRHSTTMKVTYLNLNDFVIDYTRNISMGGAFIDTPHPPAAGANILFQLYPPGRKEPIELSGQVAWQQPGIGFGIRFTYQGNLAQLEMDRVVRNVSTGTSDPISNAIFEQKHY